jgi:hypothetical protein
MGKLVTLNADQPASVSRSYLSKERTDASERFVFRMPIPFDVWKKGAGP